MNILIIEYNSVIRLLLKRMLERLNYEVFSISDEETFEQNFQIMELYDIIFLDVVTSSGIPKAQRIKEKYPHGPFLIGISGADFTDIEISAMPFDHFVHKPHLFRSFVELENFMRMIAGVK